MLWVTAVWCAALPLACSRTSPPAPAVAPQLGTATAALPAASDKSPNIPDDSGPVWFHEVTADSGIDFVHQSGTSAEKPFPAANGSGLAALDYDLDGWPDLHFLTGTPFPLDPRRSTPQNRLYRSRGDWTFVDVTRAAGLGHAGFSAGVAVGDVNEDGFPDVYINCFGPNCLFLNQGDGTFLDVAVLAGTAHDGWGTSSAMLDYDQDGLLDIYVCNYGQWSLEDNHYCGDRKRGVRIYCSPTTVAPQPDVLYRNSGDGTFADVSSQVGLPAKPARGQGVIAADINNDGWMDLYVANDMNPNMLLVNRGGVFEDLSEISGAAYDFQGRAQAGMGVDAADLNADGHLEIFVTNFQEEHNTLYANLNGDFFQDVSAQYGVASPSVAWVGWGLAIADFNLDTRLDLILTNGHVDDNRHLLGQQTTYEQPPQLYVGEQQRFRLLGAEAGEFFQQRRVGRGLVVSDLDRDGDQDVVIGHQDGRPALLRNEWRSTKPLAGAGSLSVTLHGTSSNRDAIGALLILDCEGQRQLRQVTGGGSYLSASERRQFFSWPGEATAGNLEIRWPSGIRSQLVVDRRVENYDIWEPADAGDASASRALHVLLVSRHQLQGGKADE